MNITDINGESGQIEAIGRKAAATAVQQARGDVAEQEKLGEVRVAGAEREKIVQVASASKFREIGIREAQREQAVRVAELEKEQQIGERTAAFGRDSQVKEAEQQMRIAVANANAKAIAGEAQSQAQVVATQAQLRVREAEAYQMSETRKREAEAAAIFARLEAEARGQYEILAKKGEGFKQIVEACGGAQQAYQMLMLEHLDTLAETAAKAISNIKFDKVVVWEGGNGVNNTAGFLPNMARTLPPMMQVMKDIGGVELPGFMPQIVPEVTTNGHGEPKVEVAIPDLRVADSPDGADARIRTN